MEENKVQVNKINRMEVAKRYEGARTGTLKQMYSFLIWIKKTIKHNGILEFADMMLQQVKARINISNINLLGKNDYVTEEDFDIRKDKGFLEKQAIFEKMIGIDQRYTDPKMLQRYETIKEALINKHGPEYMQDINVNIDKDGFLSFDATNYVVLTEKEVEMLKNNGIALDEILITNQLSKDGKILAVVEADSEIKRLLILSHGKEVIPKLPITEPSIIDYVREGQTYEYYKYEIKDGKKIANDKTKHLAENIDPLHTFMVFENRTNTDFEFKLKDGEITITGLPELSRKTLIFPSEVKIGDTTYPVTAISIKNNKDIMMQDVQRIYIPESIKSIEGLNKLPQLQEVEGFEHIQKVTGKIFQNSGFLQELRSDTEIEGKKYISNDILFKKSGYSVENILNQEKEMNDLIVDVEKMQKRLYRNGTTGTEHLILDKTLHKWPTNVSEGPMTEVLPKYKEAYYLKNCQPLPDMTYCKQDISDFTKNGWYPVLPDRAKELREEGLVVYSHTTYSPVVSDDDFNKTGNDFGVFLVTANDYQAHVQQHISKLQNMKVMDINANMYSINQEIDYTINEYGEIIQEQVVDEKIVEKQDFGNQDRKLNEKAVEKIQEREDKIDEEIEEIEKKSMPVKF